MKKFKTHNDGIDWKVSIGSGLLDYLTIPYDIIVKTFGEPGESDGRKRSVVKDVIDILNDTLEKEGI